MENNIKITYPGSEKVYIKGSLHPEIKVGMRVVKQMPTVSIENGKRIERKNPSVYIYDTSGPYSDPSIKTDVRKRTPTLARAMDYGARRCGTSEGDIVRIWAYAP